MSRLTKPFMMAIAIFLFSVLSVHAQSNFTGDGGKGKNIAILAPKATGLAANQNYIPSLVQGEFVSNFTSYSAISVLDRVRLDDQYKELLSGYYSDNAKEGADLGHLSPTEFIMGGNITRTATGFAMQISITKSADKMTVASYSGTCTVDELNDLSGVRRASLDLLQKNGRNAHGAGAYGAFRRGGIEPDKRPDCSCARYCSPAVRKHC